MLLSRNPCDSSPLRVTLCTVLSAGCGRETCSFRRVRCRRQRFTALSQIAPRRCCRMMYREKGTQTKSCSLLCKTPRVKVTQKSRAMAVTRLRQWQRLWFERHPQSPARRARKPLRVPRGTLYAELMMSRSIFQKLALFCRFHGLRSLATVGCCHFPIRREDCPTTKTRETDPCDRNKQYEGERTGFHEYSVNCVSFLTTLRS